MGHLVTVYKSLKEGCEDGAQWEDKVQWAQSTTQGAPSEHWKASLWPMWPTEVVVSHALSYSRDIWTWSCTAGSRWPCSSWGVGPDELQSSLPTSTINDSVNHIPLHHTQLLQQNLKITCRVPLSQIIIKCFLWNDWEPVEGFFYYRIYYANLITTRWLQSNPI